MSYYATHWKVTVFGTQYTGLETWSLSLRASEGEPGVEPTDDSVAAIASAWGNRWNAGIYCSKFNFVGVKISHIGTNGQLVPGSAPLVYMPQGLGGIAGKEAPGNTIHYPPQCTHVATLHTAATGGRARKGRLFLPPACQSIGNDGGISAGGADVLQDDIASFIGSVNATDGIGVVQVMSDLSTGYYNDVTGVSVGRVVDTQRRRRRNLNEAPAAPTPVP